MTYPKSAQTTKQEKTHIVCDTCKKKRLLKFFSSKKARKCGDCKRKAWRLKKYSSKSYITRQNDSKLREIIIERDKKCVKCGSTKTLQMSHVLTKKAHPDLRHDENNVKILCHRCHFYWWHREPMEAMEWFKSTYPERYEYLQEAKRK